MPCFLVVCEKTKRGFRVNQPKKRCCSKNKCHISPRSITLSNGSCPKGRCLNRGEKRSNPQKKHGFHFVPGLQLSSSALAEACVPRAETRDRRLSAGARDQNFRRFSGVLQFQPVLLTKSRRITWNNVTVIQ